MNLNLDTMQTLIFIDSAVTDYQSLISGAVPNAKVIILNGGSDGVAQITSALQQDTQINNVHIVSHGSPGCLYLGNSQLSLQTLDYYVDELKSWFTQKPGVKSLQRQLFLYGCSVAAGDAGEELIQKLHRLTGAEIAASAKPTGNSSLGGDWNLEVTTVAMTAELAFSSEVREAYAGVLAPPANDNFADQIDITTIDATNLTTTVNGTNVEATGEAGEQPILTDSGNPDSVINSAWWSWTAPVDGILTVDTFGSGIDDTLLGIYYSTGIDSLTPLAFNDNTSETVSLDQSFQSQLSIDVVEGEDYFIAVDGFDSEVGDITLNLDFSETIAPTIDLPSGGVLTFTTDPGLATTNQNIPVPAISDNFTAGADLLVTNSYNNGGEDASGVYNLGTTEVTYTVTDLSGNVTEAILSVVVTDTEAPTVATQNLDVFLDENGFATITPEQIDAFTTDNSGNPVDLSLDITQFTSVDLGANNVTLTATDTSGNSASNSATVTVIDAIDPTAIAQDFELILDVSGNGTISVADIDAGSSDNSGVITPTLDVTDFTIADVGPNTVTLTVTDGSGNFSTNTATVTVVDDIAPEIILQDNVTVQLDAAGLGTLTVAEVDNGSNDAASLLPIELSQTTFTVEDVGVNDVTVTVTDVNGNVSTAVAPVTVVDGIAPNPVAQNITVQLDENGEYVLTPQEIDAGSTDAAGVASLQLYKGSNPNITPADTLTFNGTELNDNTVTLVVTDVNGNEATTTATVTVEDNLAPIITPPNDIFINTDLGVPIAQVTVPLLGVTDNVDATPTIVNDFTGTADASGNYNIGETLVNYTVTDASGNQSTASFTVTVVDNEVPVLDTVNTPLTDLIVNTDPGANFATVDTNTLGFVSIPIFTDNDTQTPTVVNDITDTVDASGNYDIGDTIVTYTATDSSGNEATVSYTITVVDAEVPTISSLTNITLDNAPGLPGGQVDIPIPTADDNSAVVSLVNDYTDELDASGLFPLGTTTVTYTATDDSGNQATEVVRVLVRDVEAPTLIGVPVDTTTPFGVIPPIPEVTAEDNSGFAEVTLSEDNQGDVLLRTWTATDGAANETIATQTITFFEPIELGTESADTINGTADDDFLLSLDGNDTANANGGNDVVYGGQGNDLMNGGAGNDVLYAGAGIDNLTGGIGADIFVIAKDSLADAITDFEKGTDKIALTNGLRLGQLAITDDGTDTQIQIARSGRTIAVVSNTIGLDNTDFIDATGGSMGGNSFIAGDETDDILIGGDGNDAIRGREGNDTLVGNAGIDLVLGHGGNDELDGGAGNDYIRGGKGFDNLTGGSESDLFVLELSSGTDTILDFEVGIDLITVLGVNVNQLSTVQTNSDLNIFASGQLLATVLNVDASQVGAESFITF